MSISTENNFRNFNSNSLIHLLNKDNKSSEKHSLNLIDFIRFLTYTNEKIQSLEDLAHKIQLFSDMPSPSLSSSIDLLVRNLIFKQFPQPAFASIREIISNAIDAQVRAGKEEHPIIITVKNQQISIEDTGDGMGWSTLLNFFVPGRSSNPRALFQLETGIPKVTGRFGQGGLSPFYFLYPPQKNSNDLLSTKNSHSLDVIYCSNNKFYETSFIEQAGVFKEIISIENKLAKRQITIHTRKEQESIKMKFKGIQDKVFIDLRGKPKKNQGTCYTITSDLLESPDKIIDYLSQVFKSTVTPIFINGKKINETLPGTLFFKGGSLSYTSELESKGLLRICENGKLVVDFSLKDIFVPRELVLNFDQLCLTQERASLDFKDSAAFQALELLLDLIYTSHLSLVEKGALLNGLYPLSGPKQFNLTKKINAFIAADPQLFLPQDQKLQALMGPNHIYLNPKFFHSLCLPCALEKENYKIYFLQTCSPIPFAIVTFAKHQHIFLNAHFFDQAYVDSFQYNLSLLNQSLKSQDYPFFIDKQALFPSSIQIDKESIEPQVIGQNQNVLLDMNFEFYDKPENKRKVENVNDCIQMMAEYTYPAQEDMQKVMRCILKQSFFHPYYQFTYPVIPENILPLDIENFFNKSSLGQQLFIHKLLNAEFVSHIFLHSKLRFAYLHDLCVHYPEINDFITSYPDPYPYKEEFMEVGLTRYLLSNFFLAYENKPTKMLHQFIIQTYQSWKNRKSHEKIYYLEFLNSPYIYKNKFEKSEIIFNLLLEIINHPAFQEIDKLTIFRTNKFDTVDKTEVHLKKLNSIGKQLHSRLARHQFINWFNQLKHLDYLLTLPIQQLEKFLQILPNRNEDENFYQFNCTVKEYESLQTLSQRTDIPFPILKKWAIIFLMGCNLKKDPTHTSLYSRDINLNTNALFQLISSVLDENKAFNEKELEELIKDLQHFCLLQKEFIKSKNSLTLAIYQTFNANYSSIFRKIQNHEKKVQQITQLIQLENDKITHSKFQTQSLSGYTLEQSVDLIMCLEDFEEDKEKNEAQIKEYYRHLSERSECISIAARPFIYALLLPNTDDVLYQQVSFSVPFNEKDFIFLHQDPALIQEIGSAELAAIRIQGAIKQTNHEYFSVREICKNSQEAGANQIEFNVFAEPNKHTTVVIKDNGKGMGLEGLKALKIPGYTTKNKDLKDPNFGWGFFTVFQDFEEAMIISSQDGITTHYLNLRKTASGIESQLKTDSNQQPIGTTLILKKRQSTPLVNLIKIGLTQNITI